MTDELDKDLSADSGQPQDEVAAAEAPDSAADDAGAAQQLTQEEIDALSAGSDIPDGESVQDDALADAADGGEFKTVNDDDVPEDDAEAAMLEMLEGLPDEEAGATPDDIAFGSASVSNAEFQHLQEPAGQTSHQNIDLLMDVDLPVSIELGRTKMSISDILGLGPGSVVELNKLAGEPVDLLVNHKVVAKGEVVVVDENFGLRITQLMTPEERLKALAQE